jgi:hypothetical protein
LIENLSAHEIHIDRNAHHSRRCESMDAVISEVRKG